MKRLAIILIICLSASLLIACTGTPETTEDTTSGATAALTDELTETQTEEVTEAVTDEVTSDDYFVNHRTEIVEADASKVANLTLLDDGYDVYQLPGNGNGGWRYGPSYIYYGDGRVDAYFASGGDSGEWDRITHRSSIDDGKTWSAEKIVVYPTPDGMDDHSCCDPGAVYFNGYYYVGYTSTLNNDGYCNNIFVARSQNPDGPFEKWNGSGWGGAPAPLIYFEQSYGYWGIGEPSFVELNGTLYIYYTYSTPMKVYLMLATADAKNENWPADLQYQGALMERPTDSLDIKYVEEWGKFIGVAKADGGYIAVYESPDGKSFKLVDAVSEHTCKNPFALGLSSRPDGHIRVTEDGEPAPIRFLNIPWGSTWPVTLELMAARNRGLKAISERNDYLRGMVDRGQINAAEDRLFELIESAAWDDRRKAALVIAFYDYVNGKDDGFLAAADFSRDEIISGLEDAMKAVHMEIPEYLRIQ